MNAATHYENLAPPPRVGYLVHYFTKSSKYHSLPAANNLFIYCQSTLVYFQPNLDIFL